MATHSVPCSFTEAPWVVLAPIAQRIKAKVEAVGVPLRDWDIQINYGIKTGYNEAFVITTAKRDEILASCRDEAERARTGELIRPVLRGRDVGRYRAEWAGLWLVYISWHFPLPEEEWTVVDALGREAHRPDLLQAAEGAFAEQYPALYAYLQQHEEGLRARNKEEVGRRYEWYALQRYGAEYTGGFRRPKMIWKRVGSILRFCYDESGMLSLDSTCIAVGNHLKYLCCLLNSKMGHYLLQDTPTTGTGDLLVSVQAVEPLLIPPPRDDSFDELFNRLAGVCSDVACRVADSMGWRPRKSRTARRT